MCDKPGLTHLASFQKPIHMKRLIIKSLLLALFAFTLNCEVCAQQEKLEDLDVKIYYTQVDGDSIAYGTYKRFSFSISKNKEFQTLNHPTKEYRSPWKTIINGVERYYKTYKLAIEDLKEILTIEDKG